MKAMILAAGRGQRLRPLTDTCPKPMIPIAGKPLLEHVVRLLASHGFDQLAINFSHLPQLIRDHFGDGRGFGVEITYSFEEQLLGTAGAVRRMAAFFDEPFLVYYGDNLANANLTDLWRAHQDHNALASIGLLWMDDPTNRGIVRVDADGYILGFIEKPQADEVFDDYLINGGTYVLDPAILEHIPAAGASDFSHDIFPALLQKGKPLYGHKLKGQLLSTDTPQRYANTQKQIAVGAFQLP
jgi:mannose-1-phosphate guanylyltransferase